MQIVSKSLYYHVGIIMKIEIYIPISCKRIVEFNFNSYACVESQLNSVEKKREQNAI